MKKYESVIIIKNLFICNNCQASGTSIDLYANVKYITTKEAYKALLKEEPVLADIPYIYNNPIKDEYYRNLVYRNFLELLDLTDFHKKRLESLGFTTEYIQKNNFKSVEMCEIRKKEICQKLQKMRIKLDGIPRLFSRQRF